MTYRKLKGILIVLIGILFLVMGFSAGCIFGENISREARSELVETESEILACNSQRIFLDEDQSEQEETVTDIVEAAEFTDDGSDILEEDEYEQVALSGSILTKSKGVNYFNGRTETWYSQKVLPGGGLDIPGRHVTDDGLVRDANGYICVAASDIPFGSVIETSLGTGKVYDTGCPEYTTDIYTDW